MSTTAAEGPSGPYGGSLTVDGQTFALALVPAEPALGEDTVELVLPDGLHVRSTVTRRSPSIEWRTTVTNTSSERSGMLADLRPLDLVIDVVSGAAPAVHRWNGSRCQVDDFQPHTEALTDGATVHLEPVGGRSSDGAFPFFAVDPGTVDPGSVDPRSGDSPAVAIAIGWSGQWRADVDRLGDQVRIQAGLSDARLRLDPGESITLPTILLATAAGVDAAVAGVRATLLAHYLPQRDGGPPTPIAHMTMSTFHRTHEITEAGELAAVEAAADLGMEAFWVDACWYGDTGDWSREVGNWYVRTASFPRGLRPISDAAHARGMRFVWWIEPERARAGTRLPREHPEFFLGFPDDPDTLLLDLGNESARSYMLELISGFITEFGVDVFRQDFNVAPLPAWRAADAEDRAGIHEIRHVEGLYWLWDRLLERHPGLLIDNCASGGRRIDLETARRSVSLWRSDAADVGGGAKGDSVSIANQVQSGGLTEWIGYHTGPMWGFSPYEVRSALASGFVVYCPLPEDESAMRDLRQGVREVQRLRPMMSDRFTRLGDGAPSDPWAGVQYHRDDTGGGFAVVYRRPGSALDSIGLPLAHIDPSSTYDVEIRAGYEPTGANRLAGSHLARLPLDLPPAPAALLIEYTPTDGRH